MKIFVTGATGFVGSHLCDSLIKQGHQVWALVRTPAKFRPQEGLHMVRGTLEKVDFIPQLPADLDVVIHTAGLLHSFREQDFYRINTQGTQDLCQELSKSYGERPLHFILLSSLAAAGPSLKNKERKEEDPPTPVGHYGHSKLQAEKVLEETGSPHWRKTIFRPPMVIGPRDPAVLDVFKMVKNGHYLCAGKTGDQKQYSFICVYDLVEVILKSLNESEEGRGNRIFFTSFPQTITYRELIEAIGAALDRRPRKITLPLPLLIGVSQVLALLSRVMPLSLRLSPDKLKEIKQDFWVTSSDKSRQDLKMVYQWDLPRTVSTTLEDYRQRGWL